MHEAAFRNAFSFHPSRFRLRGQTDDGIGAKTLTWTDIDEKQKSTHDRECLKEVVFHKVALGVGTDGR
jgi:hypothetical protein